MACPETGPEIAYEFTAVADGTLRATLFDLTADLDVVILEDRGTGCDSTRCLSSGNDVAEAAVVAGNTYHLVVDGFAGAVGDFTLSLECF